MSGKLVTYFSASGITEKVAKNLAEALGADLFEIKPKEAYTKADLNWRDKESRSTIEMKNPASRPEITGKVEDMCKYDTVFVGFPIWWGVAPRAVNTFLESYDFKGKTIIPFATSGGSGYGKANEVLKASCQDAKILDGEILKPDVTVEELKEWIKKF